MLETRVNRAKTDEPIEMSFGPDLWEGKLGSCPGPPQLGGPPRADGPTVNYKGYASVLRLCGPVPNYFRHLLLLLNYYITPQRGSYSFIQPYSAAEVLCCQADTGTSAGFWLGGSMPPCRLRRRKFDYEMVHSEVYLNKYVVSIAPFSTPACRDCSQNIT